MNFNNFRFSIILLGALMLSCVACSSKKPEQPSIIIEQEIVYVQENKVPGTMIEGWQEQMIDTVAVPGQIDPTNTYYILPHKTIYEIRPGKVQILE